MESKSVLLSKSQSTPPKMTNQIIAQEQRVGNNKLIIKGQLIDTHTRCSHYHTELDIIALKFKCCRDSIYYPCFQCHEELAGHKVEKLPVESEIKAIVCGKCWYEMTVKEYMESQLQCPSCHGHFNPKCSLHYNLYFEM